MKQRIRAVLAAALCFAVLVCLSGCSAEKNGIDKLRGWGFTVDEAMLEKASEGLREGVDIRSLDAGELLVLLGMGCYDPETLERTPVTDQIYTFDMEVFDIESMYTDFLTAADAMVPEIEITEIQEDLSGMTEEMVPVSPGSYQLTDGRRSVSFRCNGQKYRTELVSYGDWFNPDFFYFMDAVLAEEHCPLKLYQFQTMAQYVVMVYCTDETAAEIGAAIRPYW